MDKPRKLNTLWPASLVAIILLSYRVGVMNERSFPGDRQFWLTLLTPEVGYVALLAALCLLGWTISLHMVGVTWKE